MSDEPFYPHVFVQAPGEGEPGFGAIKRIYDAVYRHVAPERIEDAALRETAIEKINEMERDLLRVVDRPRLLTERARRYVYLK